MRARPLTYDQIKENFEKALRDALDTGEGPSDGMGFTNEMMSAITVVALQFPNASKDAAQVAQKSLERLLTGQLFAEREVEVRATATRHGYT